MNQEKYDNYFSKINELYSQYVDIVSQKNKADFAIKWATAYRTIKEKIILTVCKVYFEFEIKKDSDESNKTIIYQDVYDDNYSDIIVEEIIKALDSYESSSSKDNGYQFSYFVCTNIRQEIGKARSKNYISVNHGGAEVSDYEATMTRRILKKDKELQKMGIYDEEKRNQKLEVLLDIGIETIQKYKILGKCQTTSTELEKDGKTYSVLDLENNLQERNFITPESEYILNEMKAQLPLLLNEMEAIFLKKPDEKTAELLAISILESFESARKIHITNGNLLSDFYPFICELISKYSCIDSKITTSFFSDPDYVLPTRKNITDKYGLDKSEATHILSRFRVKLRDQETVKKYFPDFI